MFKRIFGHIGNEDITASLISSIVEKKITNVELDNSTILEKDLLDDKVGILDIRAKIDNKINCNIEMQVVDHNNIEKRIMFYWSKMYSTSIKSGKDYETLEKTIVILRDFQYFQHNLKIQQVLTLKKKQKESMMDLKLSLMIRKHQILLMKNMLLSLLRKQNNRVWNYYL